MGTITYTGQLTTITCWCGIVYAMPSDLNRHSQETGATTYCPLGHAGVPQTEPLQKQLAEAQRRARANRDLLEAEERSHSATRGHVTRAKRQLARIGNGVCPCCNRHFTNVERHMASQHPAYKEG